MGYCDIVYGRTGGLHIHQYRRANGSSLLISHARDAGLFDEYGPADSSSPHRLAQPHDPAVHHADPFMGSGQTAIAALTAGRHFVGYETDAQYVKLAEGRINVERSTLHVPR